jgi:hypothetical protein
MTPSPQLTRVLAGYGARVAPWRACMLIFGGPKLPLAADISITMRFLSSYLAGTNAVLL